MKSAQDIKNSVANFYDTNPQGFWGVKQKLAPLKKIHNKNVLDAGCGAGYILFDYLMAGAKVTGVDQSPQSISFLKNQANEFGFNPTLMTGDLETVTLPENHFDYIFCTYVLQHTPNPGIVLSNFKKWIKPEGEIHMVISNRHSLDYFRQVIMVHTLRALPFLKYIVPEKIRKGIHWEDRFEHPYWNHLTKKEVARLCAEAGLTIRSMRSRGFTVFFTVWLPPVIVSLLDKAIGNYVGRAIYVDAVLGKEI